MMAQPTKNRRDPIGGVRCWACDKPIFKAHPSEAGDKMSGIISRRCTHCGAYNIIDLKKLA